MRGAMRERKLAFKVALNDAIRQGLRKHAADVEPRFRPATKPTRLRARIAPARLYDLDAALEVESLQTLTARIERERKTR